MKHNSIAVQHYPSEYDLLHVEKLFTSKIGGRE